MREGGERTTESRCRNAPALSQLPAPATGRSAGKRVLFLSVLTLCAFFGALLAGSIVDVYVLDGAVRCGVPVRVVDGGFAGNLPDELKNACQDAAQRWMGRALIPFVLLFGANIVVLGLVLRRRVEL